MVEASFSLRTLAAMRTKEAFALHSARACIVRVLKTRNEQCMHGARGDWAIIARRKPISS